MEKISRSQVSQSHTHNPVIGIVAEYNPFHNGHALHISRAREVLRSQKTKNTAEDAPVVVVLSSSFTQRGLPVLADKWTRAHMALTNGADLVLELPFAFACSAAPEFARGAVDTLIALEVVTHLSFGMEEAEALEAKEPKISPDAAASRSFCLASAIANILIHESCAFKRDLKQKLSKGKSYPRSLAETLDGIIPGSGAFVSMPNNALGVSYLLRILEKNYSLEILPIRREGAGHHDKAESPLLEGALTEGTGFLASAAAIRSALSLLLPLPHDLQNAAWERSWEESWVRRAMPAPVPALLERELQRGRLWMRTEKLWTLLQGFLERASPEELRQCAGMTEGMENLFLKRYREAASYEDFIGRCVCGRYTRNRLQRQVARCLAGADRWTALALSRAGPPYIRVLGYNTRGRALLRLRRQSAANAVPVITRLAAAASPAARALAALEFRASRLRELLLPHPDLKYEEKQKPIVIESS
jgi:predicted nucleotidyltransferase